MQHTACFGHTRPLTELNFIEDSGDKVLLISSAHDKHPQIRHGESGDWIGSFHGHKGAVWSAKVDKLTRTLAATASGDFSAKLWCLTTGKELHDFKHKHVVKSIDFSVNSEMFATGSQNGDLRVYTTARPEEDARACELSTKEQINKVWFSGPGSDSLLVGKKSGRIEKFDLRSGTVASFVELPGGDPVLDLELCPAHGILLAAQGEHIYRLGLEDLSLQSSVPTPKGMHFRQEGGVSLSPDGTRIMAGGGDLDLREFDAVSGEVLRVFKGHHGPIRCVRYHPSGKCVASGSEDGTIRLWRNLHIIDAPPGDAQS
jgi:serine-threonine kinase receptor-associated protein